MDPNMFCSGCGGTFEEKEKIVNSGYNFVFYRLKTFDSNLKFVK